MDKMGKIKGYNVEGNDIRIEYENFTAYVKVISKSIVNFFVPFHREERNSKAVENMVCDFNEFTVNKEGDSIVITTDELTVKVYDDFIVDIYDSCGRALCKDYRGEKAPFERRRGDYGLAEAEGHKIAVDDGYKVYVSKEMKENMYFYGLGERTGHLNKRGYHYVNWNTDDPSPHGETFLQLYKSIPFMIGMADSNAFGIFFDNHFETHFDMGRDNEEYYYFAAVDGNLDYYFINGPEISKVITGYTSLTGTTPLPQLWTLGYQQCRWSYTPRERLMEVCKSFRDKKIPCDTVYLDIDYMDGYRVFTWDDEKFNNHKEMLEELKNMGFKVVTIIDPGVKVDKGYKIFDEGMEKGYFATDKNGLTYVNEVWPGDAVYPDFMNSEVRKWWSNNQKILLNDGVSGIWNDMNEPASFRGPLPDDVMFDNDGRAVTHKEIHNVYGHMMDKATFEGIKATTNKRPFVVTRACYAGTQKYATVWTGDNQSTWEHLRMSIPMLMNLGLSGFAFCGTDVGGFGHDCSKELLSRWVQVGAFTPLFRNHAAMGTRDQEPWAFDAETEEINRKYIKLRYKFLPYFYDVMREAEKTGAPFIRPLVFNYQDDRDTYEINDQFMVGKDILVAPVVAQGVHKRMVYLPKGDTWFDYWTGEEIEGGQYIIKTAPLDVCPIYIREGAIIPVCSEDIDYVGQKDIDTLRLNIYLSDEKEYETVYHHFVDDGESYDYRDGIYDEYKITVKNTKNNITIDFEKLKKNYKDKYKNVEIFVHSLFERDVIVNGETSIKVRDYTTRRG
ncbi:glycoside hydrolase family 31 protein [Clostridium sp. MSJ-8]|uniref:glycoside hydrolase family 31 protein n=1 Tax=Clostridium sp. MSJ-8 TaxID=2841510 RepID=UPI001C0EFD38|nr:glycoside hydrolase family 31 protein [Clostridium sp. MSJ-8]MBU5488736.1 glycoside hydrolase family 31 protein [Clostridium sp. MSJ-8]